MHIETFGEESPCVIAPGLWLVNVLSRKHISWDGSGEVIHKVRAISQAAKFMVWITISLKRLNRQWNLLSCIASDRGNSLHWKIETELGLLI